MRMSPLFGLLGLVAATASPAATQTLGSIDFPTSGSDEAQPHFLRGVLLLHNFEYQDAADAFRQAREIDPSFAMAYWGEAQTHNHPIWMEQDRGAALGILSDLGTTPEARRDRTPTERERDWFETVEILYGDGTKEERDFRYRDAMRRLAEKYPHDDEAASFYALSILGTAHGGRDFAIYMRAAAVAEPVFERNPNHPGAAHYVIHAFDDPIHAPLGLPAARAYSVIAPDAGHAQHMTSHIFVAMGLWSDVISANVRARDVQDAGRARRGLGPNVCGHYTSWLHYGYLQEGRLDEADEGMAACTARMAEEPNRGEVFYFAAMRARAVIDAGDNGAADRWTADLSSFPVVTVQYDFVSALAALREGDEVTARSIRDRHGPAESARTPRDGILLTELDGLLAIAAGEADRGIELLRSAAEREEALPYEFGPPATLMPPHELLGEELAKLGRHGEARLAWEGQLARTPRRALALLGLARAASATGDAATAAETYQTLATIWQDADGGFSGVEEARSAASH